MRKLPLAFFSSGLIMSAAKLVGLIGWPWWFVTAPIWGPWAIVFVSGGFFLCVALALNTAAPAPGGERDE